MLDLRTGKEMTRRETIKGGLGLAAILAAGKAPAMLLGARGVAFGGERFRIVKRLISHGTEYIDTGFVPDISTCGYEIGITLVGNLGDVWISGCNQSTAYPRFLIGDNSSTRAIYAGFGGIFGNVNKITRVLNSEYVIHANLLNSGSITINGIDVDNISEHKYSGGSGVSFFAFGRKTQANIKSYPQKIRYIKLSRGTELMMDLIPVVKSGVGCLYDRVSDRFLMNDGTGAFGWEETDGTIVNPT